MHNASDQSDDQKRALMRYLELRNLERPFIVNLLWLRETDRYSIPDHATRVLPADVTFSELLDRVLRLNSRRYNGGYQQHDIERIRVIVESVNNAPPQTRLDRKRIDFLTNKNLDQRWHDDVGKKQIILQGRGGTGKTFALLERAVNLSNASGLKVLLLTYNHALATDLQRQLMILRDRGKHMDVQVRGIHSFLMSVMSHLGFRVSLNKDFRSAYESALSFCLADLRQRDDPAAPLREYIALRPRDYDFDLVFIDEGQDWLDDERDLLHLMYSPRSFVVAAGMDQLVRQRTPCDWMKNARNESRNPVLLHKCLRMASTLANFVNVFAAAHAVDAWKVRESVEMTGGRVIILEGDFFESRSYFERYMCEMLNLDNRPIDMLVCVPPFLRRGPGRASCDDVVAALQEWGNRVWDGTDEDIRKVVPWDDQQVRVVQYASCRGLEGFTVVNVAIDEYFDWQERDARAYLDQALFSETTEEVAARSAAAATIIPLTRAMHTLVLNVQSRTTWLGSVLWELSRDLEGVEWIQMKSPKSLAI
jgi:hypothetical protein